MYVCLRVSVSVSAFVSESVLVFILYIYNRDRLLVRFR